MNCSRKIVILCEILKAEIEYIERFFKGINEWNESVVEKLDVWESDLEKKDDASEYDREALGDEHYMVSKTRRVAYATVGIPLFAVIESFLRSLCVIIGIKIVNKEGNPTDRPNYGDFRSLIEKNARIKFDDIPCFESVDRTRILCNCLKHSNGVVSEEFAKNFSLIEGDEIRYEKEDWKKLIEDCSTFVTSLAEKIQNHV